MDYIPIILIFIPIIFSISIYILHNSYGNYLAFLSQVIITVVAIIYYKFLKINDTHIILIGGWDKHAGISLKNDWLSLSFIFLALIIWWVILIYCWDKSGSDSKFIFFLLFLEGLFLGFLQSNDLFNVFIFIEIITIISSILIVYKKDRVSLKSAIYYLLFNSTGMMFFLLGILLLYMITGTLNMDITKEYILLFKDTVVVKAAYIFMVVAVGVKSAFFPVFNWLPKAHGAAPATISALLSGLLVKSGLYIFIRLNDMFSGSILEQFFFLIGFITALSGTIFALSQKDIKQILAYSTVSQVGIILIGLSQSEGNLFYGGLLHLFNHGFFKSLLFMGAGIIKNEYGTGNIDDIKGAFKRLPYTSIFMIIAILSITGAPFFNGFISKSIIMYSLSPLEKIVFNIINLGTIIYFIKLSKIFYGDIKIKNKIYINKNLSLLINSIFCIVLGIFSKTIFSILWDIDIYNAKMFNVEKFLLYFLTIGIGVLVNNKIIDKDYNLMKKIRGINISFQNANIMLIMFISIMIVSVLFTK